jgi:two-component system, LytTR family, sensor kinase
MFDDLKAASGSRQQSVSSLGVSLACCTALGLVEATTAYGMLSASGSARTWPQTLAMTLPSWLAIAPFLTVIPNLARRFTFECNWRSSIVVHGAAAIGFSLAHLTLLSATYITVESPHTWERFTRIFEVCFRYLFLLEVLAYWAAAGMCLAMHFSNLRTSLAEARITALRAQLNPHFLFNTLHAISALALKGEHQAVAEMLGRLSDLLRVALDGTAQEVPLSVEMDFVDHYMALQRIRFADRLKVEKSIATDTLGGLVPTMILQPIVENAIKHGVNAQRGAGCVNITAERDGGDLVVEVLDTGPGFPATVAGAGIGLANTKARLEQLYGAGHRLEYGRSPQGGASVRIVIPFRQSAA